jgi:poly-beta-1,6-N-acetyl-D-glucosamine synthase
MMQFFFIAGIFVLAAYALLLLVPGLAFYARKKPKAASRPRTFISVLVPVRNEEAHLAACLESLVKQEYPADQFEIIVIDDDSTDNTAAIALQFSEKFPRLTLIRNQPGDPGKKKALTAGVRYAMGTLIATTDGDCIVPPRWLHAIAELYEKESPLFIAGPVTYKKGGLFRDLLAGEQVALQLVSGGAIRLGIPLMCSGANLAYRKDFFFASGGYENDAHASGDDMMLMLKAACVKGKLRYLATRDAIVRTEAAKGWREAVRQRGRWLSKFSAYRSGMIAVTGIAVFLANLLWLVAGAGFIAGFVPGEVALGLVAGKFGVDLLLLSLAVPFFREPQVLLAAVPGEFVYPVLALCSAVAGSSGEYSWKGRKWKT